MRKNAEASVGNLCENVTDFGLPILSLPRGDKSGQNLQVKYWETIADKLSKAGWSLGWVSAVDTEGRTFWIVDAHRDNGKRFVVRSDEIL
jgi:hypothetical protein